MKKTITILGMFFCLAATAQKKDTTIQVTMSIEQFRSLMIGIDTSIDSKKASKEIIEFLIKSAAIVPQTPKK